MDGEFQDKFKVIIPKLKQVNHLVNQTTIGPNASKTNTSISIVPRISDENIRKGNSGSSYDDQNQIPSRELWKVLDLHRQKQLQNVLNSRLHIFEEFDKAQNEQTEKKWLTTKQCIEENVMKTESAILQASQQFELNQSSQQAIIAQQTQIAMLKMKEKQEQIREKEKKRKQLLERINLIKLNQHKFYKEWQEILNILKSFEDIKKSLAESPLKIDLSLLHTLPNEIGGVVEKCKIESNTLNNISDEDVQKSSEILTKVTEFKTGLGQILSYSKEKKDKSDIKNVNKSQENVNIQKETQKYDTTVNQTTVVNQTAVVNQTLPIKTTNIMPNKEDNINKLSKFVSLNDLHLYVESTEFVEKYRQVFVQFENDQSLKNYRFDLKKAVNIPVNSLSGVNSEHITDKYEKLQRLLTGQPVLVNGKEVSAAKHPFGIAFCTDLLAKKFVLQGDLMVSSNTESAFCYATVILSLWNDFPDFGKLLIGYFYKLCPYLVPYYIPRQVGESDEEFYTKLGYQYSDGEIEKQDKFLKRMTGILKLYFAILISKPKRSQMTSPHNLKHGWKWLASFLKLEPQMDITATALHVFLETAGFEMNNKYNKMFQKVLNIILRVFLPKCQQTQCTGGAVTRLELLLSEYLKTKTFEKPDGYVESAMW